MTTSREPAADEALWVVKPRSRELTYGVSLGGDRFRVTATALSMPGRIRPGAIVETRLADDGTREIVRIVSRSTLRSAGTTLGRTTLESPELEELKQRVVGAGGQWEQMLRGILLVHVPRDSDIDLHAEFRRLPRVRNPG